MSIRANLETIRGNIARACDKAGRPPGEVFLIAVTKTVEVDQIIEALENGVKIVGENRIQEALPKIEEIKNRGYSCEWHFIGKLQRNKVKIAAGRFVLIHSVDSIPSAEEINRVSERKQIVQNVLMEVNLSGESTKEGFSKEEALLAVHRINQLKYVKLTGLMTIPPLSSNPEDSRPYFKALKKLGEQVENQTGRKIEIYSMGMSGDYEVAVEEGATHIRIGRALFGERV